NVRAKEVPAHNDAAVINAQGCSLARSGDRNGTELATAIKKASTVGRSRHYCEIIDAICEGIDVVSGKLNGFVVAVTHLESIGGMDRSCAPYYFASIVDAAGKSSTVVAVFEGGEAGSIVQEADHWTYSSVAHDHAGIIDTQGNRGVLTAGVIKT